MKEVSIFKRVLVSNLKIVMVPIVIIMLVAGYFISDNLKNTVISETEIEVSRYAESVDAEIKKVISISENTARYPLIFKGLSEKYEDHYSAFIFADEVKIFLDNLTYEMEESTLTICYNNDSLYDGKYFVSSSSVPEYSRIMKRFEVTGLNIIWEERVYVDEKGKGYLLFYENMPLNKGCFIIGKVYLPETAEGMKVITSSEERANSHLEVRKNINTHFDAIGAVDYRNINSGYIQIYSILIFMTVLIIVVLFYTTQKTTARVTRDINTFLRQLDVVNIANGELDLEKKEGEATEISIIKETISGLLTQINEITNSKYNTEMEKQTLEFELLQSQIDPHTLYNSLSAIRLGAFKRQDAEMVNFVDTMVSYYRKVLNKGKTISTIAEETDLITKYARINELSHYKKYNLSAEVKDNLENAEILHLLLQPFVENAIIHGLGGSKQDCEIKILCYNDNGTVNITVSDNGRGMNEETLDKLNNIEKHEIGYGIRNAYMRLKLFYGDNASVHFDSEHGKGTKVVIRYPI